MMTVHEVSRLTGVTVRALQYYDRIGLLPPAGHTESGYRLYDAESLGRLQQILLFRELEFSLKDIGEIVNRPDFDRDRALEQQIGLLTLKRERIGRLIELAREIRNKGVNALEFDAFDTKKLDEYAERAKAQWGKTEAYREYERRAGGRSDEENRLLGGQLMDIFAEFGKIREEGPDCEAARELVKRLRGFIDEHYYTCTDEILRGLGRMYAAGGEMTAGIDRSGGEGTAAFAAAAIEKYVG